MNMSQVAVKLQYEGEIKKVPCIETYVELCDTVYQLYKFEPRFVKFSYLDEDSDPITVSNEDDMKELFNYYGGKTPKIQIAYSGAPADQPKESTILNSLNLTSSV